MLISITKSYFDALSLVTLQLTLTRDFRN